MVAYLHPQKAPPHSSPLHCPSCAYPRSSRSLRTQEAEESGGRRGEEPEIQLSLKSTHCCCRRPEFSSQVPMFATPASETLVSRASAGSPHMCTHTPTHHIHIIKNNKNKSYFKVRSEVVRGWSAVLRTGMVSPERLWKSHLP